MLALYGSVSKQCTPVVHIKIAGKWMFIPLKMVLIGIDPYPYPLVTRGSLWQGRNIALAFINFTSHLAATGHGEIAKLATFLRWLESECSRMFQNENPRIWGLIISSVCFLNCQYVFSMLPVKIPSSTFPLAVNLRFPLLPSKKPWFSDALYRRMALCLINCRNSPSFLISPSVIPIRSFVEGFWN